MSRDATEDTRTRILEATWRLMEQQDGAQVRMTDIAARAGISRQAVYLHFNTRAELLVAATQYLDDLHDTTQRLAPFMQAETGVGKLDALIEFWSGHLPLIYGVAKALLNVKDTDEAAAAAWDDRMQAVRWACQTVIETLQAEGKLAAGWSISQATDLLCTLLSVRTWEQLTIEYQWPADRYVERLQLLARRTLISGGLH